MLEVIISLAYASLIIERKERRKKKLLMFQAFFPFKLLLQREHILHIISILQKSDSYDYVILLGCIILTISLDLCALFLMD